MKIKSIPMFSRCALLFSGLLSGLAQGQLFQNLGLLSNRVQIGSPQYLQDAEGEWQFNNDAPKGMTTGDFDGDGHADWVVARLDGKLVFGYGKGDGTFFRNIVLATPAGSYRQLVAADWNGDGRLDLAGCDPFQGCIYLFTNNGTRTWSAPASMKAWEGVRNLAAGDFNGDGRTDLIIAGPDRDNRYDWVARRWLEPLPTALQIGHGVAYYQGTGNGAFAAPIYLRQFATFGQPTPDAEDSFPRPVYSLEAWRPPGATKDHLAVAHALSNQITILTDSGAGVLAPVQTLRAQGKGIRAMTIGPVFQEAATGIQDLVVANRDLGLVEMFRGNRANTFSTTPAAAFVVPSGPRAIELSDLNADGWLDLSVVQRYGHQLITWKNEGAGRLVKSSTVATGWSPREIAGADFNEDGRGDFVVMNRISADVSILLASDLSSEGPPRTGFKALDQSYPTGGDVAQIILQDLNADGRCEVLQLHRLPQEVSIRMSLPGGKLGPPVAYKMGVRPESMVLMDANNDGQLDLVTVNIGDAKGGLYSVRMGDGTGAFGPVVTYRPPADTPFPGGPVPNPSLPPGAASPIEFGRLFSVLSVDLDNDGIKDLVAGYYDCRGVVLKGKGDGTYHTPPPEAVFTLAYESRYMVNGDFDQDGDADLAVASATGAIVVMENRGNAFLIRPNEPPFARIEYQAPSGFSGARELVVNDIDGDGDPDLISATGGGIRVLLGRTGMTFVRSFFPNPRPDGAPTLTIPGLSFPVQTMAWGRFDADADLDLATICKDDGCLRISTSDGLIFREALVVDCPQTTYLMAGDIDGDGLTDLAGTGTVLWVALSSRPTQPAPPVADDEAARVRIPGLVINEILANNDSTPVNLPDTLPGNTAPSFFARKCDSVEVCNTSTAAVNLAGWKLSYTAGTRSFLYAFPPVGIPAGGFRMILCYDKATPASDWRTGFNLAKEGGRLRLISPVGAVADDVTYPEIGSDESYARYSDGDATWALSALPNPGFSNTVASPADPTAKLNGIDLGEFATLQRVRFYATAKDDLGVLGMTIFWRRAGKVSPFNKVVLFDDGMSGDGGRLDGVYSGLFTAAPAGGTAVEFYLEAEDLSGGLTRVPGPPPSASDEQGSAQLYSLVLPDSTSAARGLEISEMMPSGSTLADPTGQLTNWVEIRNTSNAPLSLNGVELADSLFETDTRAVFPDNVTLAPGEHRLVWARPLGRPDALSGNLKLGSTNEEITLIKRDANGSQRILSYLQGGLVPSGKSIARLGAGGPLMVLPSTPGLPNLGPRDLIPLTHHDTGGTFFRLAYPTQAGIVPRVEWNDELNGLDWLPLDSRPGDGLERLHEEEISAPHRFFRLRY
jgi:Lamin Tail Domain/FG-GAP-like repeat/FG-GAP repeat